MFPRNFGKFVPEACGKGLKAFMIDWAHVHGDVVRHEIPARCHHSLRVKFAAHAPRNFDGLESAAECPRKSTLDQPLESVLETLEAHAE